MTRPAKRGRGRPRIEETEKQQSLALTQKLAREIKDLSGLTVEALVQKMRLSRYKGIATDDSTGVWRKYLCARAIMSPARMRDVSAFAWEKGWRGETVRTVLVGRGNVGTLSESNADAKKMEELQAAIFKIFGHGLSFDDPAVDEQIARIKRLADIAIHAAVNDAFKKHEQHCAKEAEESHERFGQMTAEELREWDEKTCQDHEEAHIFVPDIEHPGFRHAIPKSQLGKKG